jgi:hypothetical protein
MKKALIPIAFAALFLGGCFADNYEKLHPVKSTPAKCDTTGVISFASRVEPIFQANCLLGCHSASSASGGVILDSWAGAKRPAANGQLVSAVTHSGPNGGTTYWMPITSTLSPCDINTIVSWVNKGYLNN